MLQPENILMNLKIILLVKWNNPLITYTPYAKVIYTLVEELKAWVFLNLYGR